MYDWANSAYTTTTLAVVLPALFASEIVPEGGTSFFGRAWDAESLFSLLVAFTALVAFVLSPVLGAIGDYSASKRRFLQVFAYAGALLSLLFFFLRSGDVVLTMVLFLVVETCWAVAAVFYDSFLPHLSTPDTIDRISSRGFAFGYLGGGLQFALSLALIQLAPSIGIDDGLAARLAMIMAGLWWLGFGIFAISRLREPAAAGKGTVRYGFKGYVRLGFSRTWRTARRLGGFPHLLLFLIAFFAYNDGVQTVIAISSVYATETLGLAVGQVAIAFLVVQVVAFLGALLFGQLATRMGAKRAILLSLVLWTGLAVFGYQIPESNFGAFLLLAGSVGLVLGGTQALSRSLYGSMIPEEASAEFYGFYSVFSRFSSIWGPLTFGVVNAITGSSRRAVLSLVILFVVGFVLLAAVNVEKARSSKERWEFAGDEVEAAEA
jgi:UMF1 family MFS transporter